MITRYFNLRCPYVFSILPNVVLIYACVQFCKHFALFPDISIVFFKNELSKPSSSFTTCDNRFFILLRRYLSLQNHCDLIKLAYLPACYRKGAQVYRLFYHNHVHRLTKHRISFRRGRNETFRPMSLKWFCDLSLTKTNVTVF